MKNRNIKKTKNNFWLNCSFINNVTRNDSLLMASFPISGWCGQLELLPPCLVSLSLLLVPWFPAQPIQINKVGFPEIYDVTDAGLFFKSDSKAIVSVGVGQGMVTGIRGLCNGLGPALYGFIFYIFHVELDQVPEKEPDVTHHHDPHQQVSHRTWLNFTEPRWLLFTDKLKKCYG